MSLMLLLAALLPAEDPRTKFIDVTLEKPFDRYLQANALLMEVAGAKVIRLKDGKRLVLAVGSSVLPDDKPETRLEAESVCQIAALASIVAERSGVQIAHEEVVREKTIIVIEDGKEKARSVTEVLSLTRARAKGIVRGMRVVGRWRSKDGKVLYVAVGTICDKNGDPLSAE